MSYYDSDTIESISVSEVERMVRKSGKGRLVADIAKKDKEPSWDGNIKIYKSADSKSKDNLDGTILIQVKGKEVKNFSRKFISYPIEVSDLENYVADGIIYFVVEIMPVTEECKVFYKCMNCKKIQSILDEINYESKKKGKKQKTKNIKIDCILSESANFIKDCIDFKIHKDHQSLALVKNAINFDSIKNPDKMEFLTFPTPNNAINKTIDPYIRDEYGSLIPVKGEFKIKSLKRSVNIDCDSDLKKYFDKINLVETEKEKYFECGDILNFYINNNTIKLLESQGTINERIKTLEFLIENTFGEMKIFEENDLDKFEGCKKELSTLRNIEKMSNKLGIDVSKIQTRNITDSDVHNVQFHSNIYSLSDYINLPKEKYDNCELILFEFLGKRILLFKGVRKDSYECVNFYDKGFDLEITIKDDSTLISRFILLNKDAILCDNFNSMVVIDSIKEHILSDKGKYADNYLRIALELIKAWDEVNCREYLLTAQKINELVEQYLDKEISIINYAQIEIRLNNKLSEETLGKLYDIRYQCENNLYLAGALILLKDYESFRKCFELLSAEDRNGFKDYPIYNLLSKTSSAGVE